MAHGGENIKIRQTSSWNYRSGTNVDKHRLNEHVFYRKDLLTVSNGMFCLISVLAQQPNAGQGRLILEVSISHTMTHHSRWDSTERRIDPSQRPLPDNTAFTRDRHPRSRRDSNPQSQQVSGRRSSP